MGSRVLLQRSSIPDIPWSCVMPMPMPKPTPTVTTSPFPLRSLSVPSPLPLRSSTAYPHAVLPPCNSGQQETLDEGARPTQREPNGAVFRQRIWTIQCESAVLSPGRSLPLSALRLDTCLRLMGRPRLLPWTSPLPCLSKSTWSVCISSSCTLMTPLP
ncbi:hypothetical protein SODALDRAFT_15096 [Sodiomyces alkalinus F11]|uniref:Uncharacterized protein n=1 Tax=Sodiomyces alkalinus (strain CBS 110278 / VKM F-3762 / F11) TaxID=1314773 RepID=A0A3N2Q6L3_SODAK|nr:hypothetical protein SODALDRAFT_15096 [Sodiomyces alkalinus F11]ROT42429.1 hypothetical protein SODALDRAFT_15096 [Sodiomyces alkalinus F11]